MSSPNQPAKVECETTPLSTLAELRVQLRPLLVAVPLLTLITGVLYPGVLATLARPLFRDQANGSLVEHDGVVVGSAHIGRGFYGPGMFHCRPSAAGDNGYDGTASGGSNRGPANKDLLKDIRNRASQYRDENNLSADTPFPIDAVTSSGSGLDPHISPSNANLQVRRVALERNLTEDDVRKLVTEYTQGRQFGFLGEPRVNVFLLNLALERKAPHPHDGKTP